MNDFNHAVTTAGSSATPIDDSSVPARGEAEKPRPACFFSLADELYAIGGQWASEVAVIRGATPVPRTAPFVLGVGNLRGRVVPLIDLNPLLGREVGCISDELLVLVIKVEDRSVGLLVDEVLRFGFYLASSLKPATAAATRLPARCLLGWLHLVGQPVHLIDAPLLLEELGREELISSPPRMDDPAPFEPLSDFDPATPPCPPQTT